MGKKSGSGIRIRYSDPGLDISESLETIFLVKILKFFDVDSLGWKKFGSGIRE
jgi:hypothetical protein